MVLVRIPIQSLARDVKIRNNLVEELFDVKLEGDTLVLLFKKSSEQFTDHAEAKSLHATALSDVSSLASVTEVRKTTNEGARRTSGRQRRRSKRNRMKTHGWQIAAKIVNSKGQTAVVYRPFVQALFGKDLTPIQQRAIIAEILRSNGNDPTKASTEYFLMNTLEYLKQVNKPESGA